MTEKNTQPGREVKTGIRRLWNGPAGSRRKGTADGAPAEADGRERHGKRPDKPNRVQVILHRSGFQRGFLFLVAAAAVYLAMLHGATPERYRLAVGDISVYDITAPRDIINTIRTEELAQEKADKLAPVIIADDRANIDMLNQAHSLVESLGDAVAAVRQRVVLEAVAEPEEGYYEALFRDASGSLHDMLLSDLTERELAQLAGADGAKRLSLLKTVLTDRVLAELFRSQITQETLRDDLTRGQAMLEAALPENPWLTIGNALLVQVLKPNSAIDREATEAQRAASIEAFLKESPVVISKDERIINRDDLVTADKWQVLRELNYIEDEGGVDVPLHVAILVLTIVLATIALVFIRRFQPLVFQDPNLVAISSLVVVLVCAMAWLVREFLGEYAPLLLPIYVVPVLLSTLVGLETAIIVNAVLAAAFLAMFGGDATFFLTAFAGGSIAAFLTHQASQRRRLSMSGIAIGALNAALVAAMGILEKRGLESLLNESGLAFINGILSVILAIGLLPFLEGAFNVITPFKLLELADPNHPLIKRLLIEAPGTWHHSLMVGNLAEAAIRSIGGNALLARVGAYYHDIGKLKRPNFFKENQLGDNPHERLTPNLSTLVITSHTRDGDELAVKYKLPRAIRDIIRQHHGTTLVAYFYHKASQAEKDGVDRDNFRYEGPVPDNRESAVVMLADSVEAAVRSIPDKTQGKIEGLVRKIIRDKLDDGQLDRCDLTLGDLSRIADSFLQVLGGAFHERPEYPEIERRPAANDLDNQIYAAPTRPAAPAAAPAAAEGGDADAGKT